MEPTITTLSPKKMIGKRLNMSLQNNLTGQLWQSFMPRKKEIQHVIGIELYSMQIYPLNSDFSPTAIFEKWATVAVSSFDNCPVEMETFLLEGGLYAVFLYIGSSSDASIFQYIFGTWLPNSIYELDNRPHFEILGEKYKNNDPNSEEEIWIPIKPKQS